MKISREGWIAIVIAVLVILLLLVLPSLSGDPRQRGSTYSLAPSGYAAWYDRARQQNRAIVRWEKPLSRLWQQPQYNANTTLLQVLPREEAIFPQAKMKDSVRKWLSRGNRWIVLGIPTKVTKANFTTRLPHEVGSVKIDTSRRLKEIMLSSESGRSLLGLPNPTGAVTQELGDNYGTIVSKSVVDRGEIILVSTADLAANAYRRSEGNFDLLDRLVFDGDRQVVVDEFMHGYGVSRRRVNSASSDRDEIDTELPSRGSWFDYLARTPFAIFVLNIIGLTILAIWGTNRQFGNSRKVHNSQLDNSSAYVRALAAILRKSGRTDFATFRIGRAERLALQRRLGLGNRELLPAQTVIDALAKQGDNSHEELANLNNLIQTSDRGSRLNENRLATWLSNWQKIREKTK